MLFEGRFVLWARVCRADRTRQERARSNGRETSFELLRSESPALDVVANGALSAPRQRRCCGDLLNLQARCPAQPLPEVAADGGTDSAVNGGTTTMSGAMGGTVM